ncbi:hypothetical protein F0Z19_5076 [Vibrio cyclitrophicus]|uniref:hypothetical protein n=1 Tax=unclassified Vibrio TaxID=2614977 RepID=UPI001274AABF|nr:hypothetical protein F0Z19_5076 [Vibrio cyclitrophicus]
MLMKKLLLTSVLFAVTGTAANAADPDANVVFRGLVGNSIPGDTLIITGNNGAKQIADGVLLVNQNGTFETLTPVKIEAREYTPADTVAATAELIGEVDPKATWRVTGVTTLFGANTSTQNTTVVTDTGSASLGDFTVGTQHATPAGELTLSVKNDTEVTDVDAYNAVTVSVAITATPGA